MEKLTNLPHYVPYNFGSKIKKVNFAINFYLKSIDNTNKMMYNNFVARKEQALG